MDTQFSTCIIMHRVCRLPVYSELLRFITKRYGQSLELERDIRILVHSRGRSAEDVVQRLKTRNARLFIGSTYDTIPVDKPEEWVEESDDVFDWSLSAQNIVLADGRTRIWVDYNPHLKRLFEREFVAQVPKGLAA